MSNKARPIKEHGQNPKGGTEAAIKRPEVAGSKNPGLKSLILNCFQVSHTLIVLQHSQI